VAIELVEFDRVGEDGRAGAPAIAGEGSGRAGFEGTRWWCRPGNGEGGATLDVGVGIGVACEDKEMDVGAGIPGFAAEGSGT